MPASISFGIADTDTSTDFAAAFELSASQRQRFLDFLQAQYGTYLDVNGNEQTRTTEEIAAEFWKEVRKGIRRRVVDYERSSAARNVNDF